MTRIMMMMTMMTRRSRRMRCRTDGWVAGGAVGWWMGGSIGSINQCNSKVSPEFCSKLLVML